MLNRTKHRREEGGVWASVTGTRNLAGSPRHTRRAVVHDKRVAVATAVGSQPHLAVKPLSVAMVDTEELLVNGSPLPPLA